MRICPLLTVALGAGLLASNGYWLFQVIDSAVTASYQEQAFGQQEAALTQLQVLAPRLAAGMSRERVLALAIQKGEEPFTKDGAVWIGDLGFVFDGQGRLASVRRAWDDGNGNP